MTFERVYQIVEVVSEIFEQIRILLGSEGEKDKDGCTHRVKHLMIPGCMLRSRQ